ncbi:helix-turn-helix transcriptional regulator [Streptomyces sp. ZYX-F-203]
MLGVLGLEERQESVYRALVAIGAGDVPDLARGLALDERDTERALLRLEQRGLATRSSSGPGRWVAAPPGVALGALLSRRRHELEKAELAAALLAEEHRVATAEPAVRDLVEVVIGATAVAQRVLQLRLGATEEVCALVVGGLPTADGRRHGSGARKAVGAVRHRVVLERSVLDRGQSVAELTAGVGWGEEIRIADRLPTGLMIADGSCALVPPAAPSAEPSALIVRAGGLLRLLSALFESVWRDALPLRLGASEGPDGSEESRLGPDPTDLEILSLLLAGLTDASVAKHLELGLRTVQRRVRRLMEMAGVTTRLQLGWHAYERGWVAREHRTRSTPGRAPRDALRRTGPTGPRGTA